MKALTNFIVDDLNLDTISEAAKKATKQETWPNNVDAANKKAKDLLSQATDVDDIDVTKVVKGKETKNSWAVEPPNPNWEKEIADFDPEDYETKKCGVLFMAVDNVKFRKPVRPGDQLKMHLEKVKMHRNIFVFHGVSKVDDQVVSEADLTAMIIDE